MGMVCCFLPCSFSLHMSVTRTPLNPQRKFDTHVQGWIWSVTLDLWGRTWATAAPVCPIDTALEGSSHDCCSLNAHIKISRTRGNRRYSGDRSARIVKRETIDCIICHSPFWALLLYKYMQQTKCCAGCKTTFFNLS